MKITRIIATVAAMSALVSCTFVHVNGKLGNKFIKGEGEMLEKAYNIGEVRHLTCNVPAELTIKAGGPSLTIDTYQNIHEALSVVSEGGELVIKGLDDCNFRDTKLKIELSCGSIETMEVNGAVDLKTPDGLAVGDISIVINGAFNWETDGLTGNSIKLVVNGAGNCDISGIDIKTMDLKVNGAGKLELAGKADKVDACLDGAGNIDVKNLKCDDVSADVNGLGTVKRN